MPELPVPDRAALRGPRRWGLKITMSRAIQSTNIYVLLQIMQTAGWKAAQMLFFHGSSVLVLGDGH